MATKNCNYCDGEDISKTEESLTGLKGIIKGMQRANIERYSFDCERCQSFRFERIGHGSGMLQPYEKSVRIGGYAPIISPIHYKITDMRQKQLSFELGKFLGKDIEIADGNISVMFSPIDESVANDEFFYCGGGYNRQLQQPRKAPIETATVERVKGALNSNLSLDSLIGNSVSSTVLDFVRRNLADLYLGHNLCLDDFMLSVTPTEEYLEIHRARGIIRSAHLDEHDFMPHLTLGTLIDPKNPFIGQLVKKVGEADRVGAYEKYGYLRKTFVEFLDSFARTAKIDFGYDSMKAMQILATMATFLDLGKNEIPPRIGELFEQLEPRAKQIEPAVKVLEAPVRGELGYTALSDGLECVSVDGGSYEDWLESLDSSGKILLVLGKRGSGKSALAFRLAEYINATQKRPVFAVGFPQDKIGLLPSWMFVSHDPEACDAGSFILVDEAGIQYLAYNYKSPENQLINQLMQITRHKGQLMAYTTQNGATVDKNIIRQSDSVIFKMPGLMQKETDRPEFRRWALDAERFFNDLKKDERKSIAVVRDNDFCGAIRFELPGFWNEELSTAWNSYSIENAQK